MLRGRPETPWSLTAVPSFWLKLQTSMLGLPALNSSGQTANRYRPSWLKLTSVGPDEAGEAVTRAPPTGAKVKARGPRGGGKGFHNFPRTDCFFNEKNREGAGPGIGSQN